MSADPVRVDQEVFVPYTGDELKTLEADALALGARTFNLPTEADERAELAAVGIELPDPSVQLPQSELLAHLSNLMRVMGDHDKEIAQLEETRAAEKARIDMRYKTQIDSVGQRRRWMESYLLSVAPTLDYGKKKSLTLGYGKIGYRQTPERVEITDEELALAFAKKHAPDGGIKIKEAIVRKIVDPIVLKMVHVDGEEPLGFECHPASDKYFVTPEVE
jgi:phage host-nuclease inhibitor protein Gam